MMVMVMMLLATETEMEMVMVRVVMMGIVRPGRMPQRYGVLRQGIHCTAKAKSLHLTTF